MCGCVCKGQHLVQGCFEASAGSRKGVEHQRPDHSAHIAGAPQGVLEVAQVLSTHDLCHRAF